MIVDDETLLTVTLLLSRTAIDEVDINTTHDIDPGVSRVTTTRSGKSSETAEMSMRPVGAGDYTPSADRTLTITAGNMSNLGTVTMSRVASGGNEVANPWNATLTIRDDGAGPHVTLTTWPVRLIDFDQNPGEDRNQQRASDHT